MNCPRKPANCLIEAGCGSPSLEFDTWVFGHAQAPFCWTPATTHTYTSLALVALGVRRAGREGTATWAPPSHCKPPAIGMAIGSAMAIAYCRSLTRKLGTLWRSVGTKESTARIIEAAGAHRRYGPCLGAQEPRAVVDEMGLVGEHAHRGRSPTAQR